MQKLVYLAAGVLVLLGITAGSPPLNAQAKSATDDKSAIKALYAEWNDAFNKKDVNAIMAVYAPNVFVFDAIPPANIRVGMPTRRTGRVCSRRFPARSPTPSQI